VTENNRERDPRFEAVRATFGAHFDEGQELGASVAVTKHGGPVVDLWAGDADTAGRPWERDTIVNVWSVTKTMSAICLLMLADRGEVDLNAPIATYWPEFAVQGKEHVSVAHVLGHTAGLPGWDPPIATEVLF
jgi:CubicO group peptidase (beta-lactamase class C family)